MDHALDVGGIEGIGEDGSYPGDQGKGHGRLLGDHGGQRMATIYGVAFSMSADGQQTFLPDFGEVWLDTPDGRRIRGYRIDYEFVTTEDEASPLFFIPGIPPTTPDRPYTLNLTDSQGREVPGYRQMVAPVAGGIMTPHN